MLLSVQDHDAGEMSIEEEMQYARLQAFIVRPDALHDLYLATVSGQPVAPPARQCPPIGAPVRLPLQSGVVVWWQLTQEVCGVPGRVPQCTAAVCRGWLTVHAPMACH